MIQWNLLLEEVTPIATSSPIMHAISRDDPACNEETLCCTCIHTHISGVLICYTLCVLLTIHIAHLHAN